MGCSMGRERGRSDPLRKRRLKKALVIGLLWGGVMVVSGIMVYIAASPGGDWRPSFMQDK
jgi:hypothetical protein